MTRAQRAVLFGIILFVSYLWAIFIAYQLGEHETMRDTEVVCTMHEGHKYFGKQTYLGGYDCYARRVSDPDK